jgi:hypothetical protein
MDHNFGLYLSKFFSKDINGNLEGEKETRRWEKKSSISNFKAQNSLG